MAETESDAGQQIAFINAAHFLTHHCLLVLPTAVLVMVRPGGEFGSPSRSRSAER